MFNRKRTIILTVVVMALSLFMVGLVSAQEATPEASTPETAFLGVTVQSDARGARVASVIPESPAEAAGIQPGDIIVAVDGETVTAESLAEAISSRVIGDVVLLEVLRDPETLQIEATLALRPDELALAPPHGGIMRGDFGSGVGDVEVEFLPDDGVIVINALSEDSPLAEAGLMVGDRITAINGEEIGRGQMRLLLPDMRDNTAVTLTIERDGETVEVEVSPLNALELFAMGMGQGFRFGERGFGEGGRNPLPEMRGFEFGFREDRGWLGVAFVTLDDETAAENGIAVSEGGLITEVTPDSPASAAGLQVNDVITAVNDEPVDAERTLADRVAAYEAGDVLTLDVLRGAETLQIEVTLGQRERRIEFGPGSFPDMPGFGNGPMRPFGFGQGSPIMPPAPQPVPTPGSAGA